MHNTTLPAVKDRAFIVSSCYGWGKGSTIAEALKKAKTQKPRNYRVADCGSIVYRAKLVHKDITCDGGGGITYSAEFPPLDLGVVAE